MDRKWMSKDLREREYEKGMEKFIAFAVKYAKDPHHILCPCLQCCFQSRLSVEELRDHLTIYGIDKDYTNWVRHVEKGDVSSDWGSSFNEENEDMNIDKEDQLHDLARTIEDDLRDCSKMFENLSNDAKTPLYAGCEKFTRLSAILKLYNLKASNGWSDKSFTTMLQQMKEMLPNDNTLPNSAYEAKKMLRSVGLSYEKIHACPNDCILYRKEYASLKSCPECNVSRYKKKEGVPAKVLWYFPIVPRFRRLFNNPEEAKNLTWHADGRIVDGMLRHPADAPQWTKIDRDFPHFSEEARNLRLALATDGMNPFGGQTSSHSVWPVMLVIYNLPPELCMKRKYIMLSMLISGPKQSGNDIDIYFEPLIDDLKMMWETGVEVFDAYRQENFNLKAMLFGTINDFPTYGNFSGYSVKGYKACPICEENTFDLYLSHKVVYPGTRIFLPACHHYRRQKTAFNGKTEYGRAPSRLTGEQVFDKVKGLHVKFEKKNSEFLPTMGYKKKSKFFDLPYWKSLYVRHFLDVMHIEKNIFDSLIGDLVDQGIRKELHPVKRNGRQYLPPACHTLSRKEKVALCKYLSEVKVPEGYSSNIRNLVSMKELKLVGLKSHDCHILMEYILPVALRAVLPIRVRRAITRLCLFFTEICRKVIDLGKLRALQKEIVVTLCQLEMFFPPSFFDIMVHLTVHLVKEVELCGPVYLRWMYPIERFMKVLKGYVMNHSRPEGCIVERAIVEEAVNFCSSYISDMDPIDLPKSKFMEDEGKGITGNEVEWISRDMWRRAHLYVLHNSAEVNPYMTAHMTSLRCSYPTKSEAWIVNEHNRTFIDWLKQRVADDLERKPGSVCDRLRWLSRGPRLEVLSYCAYQINGYTFYTRDRDDQSTMQNSGVTLKAEAMHISSVNDKNPIYASMSYYGVIDKIWELDYNMFRIPVFGCNWADNKSGIEVDDFGFTQVNFTKVGHKEEPFIIASQARQVFYVPDPCDDNCSVVIPANKRNTSGELDEDGLGEDSMERPSFTDLPSLNDELSGDDVNGEELYIRHDHSEGIYLRPHKRCQIRRTIKVKRVPTFQPLKKRKR